VNKRQKLIFHWSLYFIAGIAIFGILAVLTELGKDPAAYNEDGSIDGLTSVLEREVDEKMLRFKFEEISIQAGIDFQHFPFKRQSQLPEDMGSGLAWGDYDNDGDDDLFMVNFQSNINKENQTEALAHHVLYQNDGNGHFIDVTEQLGLDKPSFGMSAAWGDFDNDQDLDLYIGNYGSNQLYRNDGQSGFVEITELANVIDNQFSASVSWGDFNNDGWIDLYICNYVDYIFENTIQGEIQLSSATEIPFTINPSSYDAVANKLYQNNGDGTFKNVAKLAGVDNPDGRSLVAAWFDYDNDGFQDLYIANDISSNGVYHNLGNGTFKDIGAQSLAADYRGAMGLAVGDFDRDSDFDLFVTHWLAQENALYRNNSSLNWKDDTGNKRLFFIDEAEVMGLGQISLKMVGWSTSFADFDNDGLLDLWVVNGNTLQNEMDNSLLEPQQLHFFRQEKSSGFYEISKHASSGIKPFVGRGGAQSDFDKDGKVDVAIMRFGQTPLLLKNISVTNNHWITLRLSQIGGNTRALGARVQVRTNNDVMQSAQVGSQGLYLSQNSTDLHFGLNTSDLIDEIKIYWPDGQEQILKDINANQIISLQHKAQYN
jgi:hypothetical protein